MRVGLVAPPWLTVPPTGYGGTELVIDLLARGLARRGHDVRLFTVGSSTAPVVRFHLFDQPQVPMGNTLSETAHVLAAYEALREVDVIHDHTSIGPIVAAAAGTLWSPAAVTNHGPFTPTTRPVFGELARHAAVVAVSHDQAHSAGPVPVAAVIHHGIDTDLFRPGDGGGGYALFLGRMSPDKGAHRAIGIARAARLPLVIATRIREAAEREYFAAQVEPLLGPDVQIVEEVPVERKVALYRDAVAFLNPISWPEPFGLVMIEALACGTPVLAFPSGAAPEIVEHGRTGFLCPDEAAMAEHLRGLDHLSRSACRRSAEQRFSMERMAADHERLYERLLEGAAARGSLPRHTPGEAINQS